MGRLKTVGLGAALLGAAIFFWLTRAFVEGPPNSRVEITPARAFLDDPVKIILRGFPAKRSVTVRVRAGDDLARTWESRAEFLTDADGMAEVAKQRPISGTYQRTDASGLFWSMTLLQSDKMESPFACGSLKPVEFEVAAELNGRIIATSKFQRIFVAPGVERIPVRDGRLRGTFFVPSGKGPHPGVIVLGGSDGGLHELGAAFLASKGYAALALAYFAFEDLPKSLENIPLEYFESGLDWLRLRKEVRGEQIAVMGGSRGGELALILGSTFHQIKAVVAFVPSGVIWGGLSNGADGPEQPAWTYQGRPLPFMSIRNLAPDQHKRAEVILHIASASPALLFKIFLEDRAAVEKASIPVEQINGPVLLISGKEDRIWPSTMLADMVMETLKRAKHPFPDRHLDYEGAGHFISIPNLPTTVNTMVHPVTKMEITFGGDAAHTAAAATDVWRQIVAFLHERFPE